MSKQDISVRSYQDKAVGDELLMKVLEAARFAPSACNNQPLSFIIIRESIKRLQTVYNRDWFLNAPAVILVSYDRNSSWKRGDGKEYGEVDAAIAMDHITLAAAELGLGTCWIGAFNAVEAHKVLLLPENIIPVAFTPIGFPAPSKVSKKRKELKDLIHWEFYGGSRH